MLSYADVLRDVAARERNVAEQLRAQFVTDAHDEADKCQQHAAALRQLAALVERAAEQPVPLGMPTTQDEIAAALACCELLSALQAGFDPATEGQ